MGLDVWVASKACLSPVPAFVLVLEAFLIMIQVLERILTTVRKPQSLFVGLLSNLHSTSV